MTRLIQILLLLTVSVDALAASRCTPQVKKSNPPRLINGEWVKDETNSASSHAQADLASLMKKKHAFIFSGVYAKEVSFSEKNLSYIETKKIWRGQVPKSIDLDSSELPFDNNCDKPSYDQTYVFFAVLGPRNAPIKIKTFRTITPELKKRLGKPEKQWLRNRLINTPK